MCYILWSPALNSYDKFKIIPYNILEVMEKHKILVPLGNE